MTPARETSCGIVLFRKTARGILFLLLHYAGGHWEFPKGHVEAGESEEQTARRETCEETGITELSLVQGFREVIEYYYTCDGAHFHKEVIFFLAEVKQEKVVLSFEHQGFAWLSYEDALERLSFETAKGVLRKAYDQLKGRTWIT